MVQQLITPNRLITPNFVGAIITFLRTTLGESVYTDSRLSDPLKNISSDFLSVQFHSLVPDKEITSLWNCLKKSGLEVKNLTPGDSNEKVTRFKISLNLPKEFLLEYGNSKVKKFCEEFVSEGDSQNQVGSSVKAPNQESHQQGSVGENQTPLEETPEIEEGATANSDDETIKTVKELIQTVFVLESKQKVRTTTRFFKWYLEQNEVIDYEVLPRTAYKYRGNEPEFVVRILNTDDIPKVFKLLQSQGCDVDLVGEKKDGVRVKSLVIVDSTQTGKTKHKKVAKPNPKKAVKVSKKSKKKIFKKPTSKTVIKVKESEFKFFRERCLRELTEVVKDFLSKTERPKEQDLNIFQKMIELKKQELEVLNKLEKEFNELNKVRVLFLKKYSS